MRWPSSRSTCALLLLAVTALAIVHLPHGARAAPASCGHTYNMTVCAGLVDYPFYLPENYTFAMLEGAVQLKADKLQSAYPSCRKQALAFACAAAFQPCQAPYPLPKPACRSLCVNTTKLCASTFLTAGVPLTDCLETNPSTGGQPSYPEEHITLAVPGVGNVNVTCNPMQAQTASIEAHNPCTLYTGTLCKGFLDHATPYLVPPGYTPESLEEQVRALQRKLSVAPKKCREAATLYACSQAFRPCTTKAVRVPVASPEPQWPLPFQRPPCRSNCDAVVDQCAALFAAAGQPLPNCAAVDAVTHGPAFPVKEANYSGVLVECNNYNGKTFAMPAACPNAMVHDGATDVPCHLPCPLPIFDKPTLWSLIDLASVLGWLSFLGSLFVIVTHLTFPHKRQFPQVMFLHMAFAALLFSLAPVMASIGDPTRDLWCRNSFEAATLTEPACGFQAFLIQFFALQAAVWWLCIVGTLYAILVLERRNIGRYFKFMILAAWAFPGLFTAVAFISGHIGYHNGSLWCWISDADDGWWQYGLFYIELISLVAVGTFFTFSIVAHISRVTTRVNRKSSAAVRGQIRQVAFALWILLTLVFVFAYRVNEATNEDKYESAVRAYVVCLVNNVDESLCSIKERPSYVLTFLHTFFFTAVGLGVFFIIGLTDDTISSWKGLIDRVRGRAPPPSPHLSKQMSSARLITRETDSGSSSGSNSRA